MSPADSQSSPLTISLGCLGHQLWMGMFHNNTKVNEKFLLIRRHGKKINN